METRSDLIQGIVDRLLSGESSLSYSSLSYFKESPKSFIDYKLKRVEPTDAMIFGSMVHCLILEPEKFTERYYVIDDESICVEIGGAKPRATNAYKSWYASEEIKACEKICISISDFKAAEIQSLNVRYNAAAAKVLKRITETEKPIEWDYKNFKFRGVLDGLGDVIVDLKSCTDANPRKFQRDIISMDYYLQAACYVKGIYELTGEVLPYYIIAFDKSNGVSVHQLTDTLITFGMDEYEMLCDKMNECILKDGWNQSYDFWAERFDGIYYADKPGYLYK